MRYPHEGRYIAMLEYDDQERVFVIDFDEGACCTFNSRAEDSSSVFDDFRAGEGVSAVNICLEMPLTYFSMLGFDVFSLEATEGDYVGLPTGKTVMGALDDGDLEVVCTIKDGEKTWKPGWGGTDEH